MVLELFATTYNTAANHGYWLRISLKQAIVPIVPRGYLEILHQRRPRFSVDGRRVPQQHHERHAGGVLGAQGGQELGPLTYATLGAVQPAVLAPYADGQGPPAHRTQGGTLKCLCTAMSIAVCVTVLPHDKPYTCMPRHNRSASHRMIKNSRQHP